MYKNILFDWDGCLASTLDTWVEICKEALRLRDISATNQEIWQAMCCSGVALRFEVPDKQAFRDDVTRLLLERQEVGLHPGANDFLQKYHKRKAFAIVSNTRSQALKRTMRQHRLEPYFYTIIDDASGVKPKPDPEGIHRAMASIDARPEETIMIGDSGADVLAARNAGIASALFYPPAHQHLCRAEHLFAHQPSHIIRNFSELSMLVT